MEKIDGKQIADTIKQRIAQRINDDYLGQGKNSPCLACVLVGDDPASQTYVASKEKTCAQIGMRSRVYKLDKHSSFGDVKNVIQKLNQDDDISGILLQLPLPQNLRLYEDALINTILPSKDVDSLTNENLGKLFADKSAIAPCTASGIIKLLKEYNIKIAGKRVTVVGRSLLVGKSVAMLLLKENATVQICTSHTKNLADETKQADILVVAIGKPQYITQDMVKDGAVVIDVGINRVQKTVVDKDSGQQVQKNVLVGDVDYENVKDKCSYITPVPGGVGPMTIAELMQNTITLHEQRQQEDNQDLAKTL
ncbi:MAG: bifunctional methylenetetrahydrofolate dehydrogenase/methenyltetrahydrofolate cyclohydrolase FolD [Clostridia bacterium]|nr:bifunctional methylenetetrahydrofolate dehydrogenase/methenyltetrahydrofolate cyclohydrolase FolD [Clostridia bacterium]